MRVSLLAACGMLAAAACATSPAEDGQARSDVEHASAPVYLGCPGYVDPTALQDYRRVTLQFVVREDGSVDPNSIVERRSSNTPSDPLLAQRAREVAESCRYEPAIAEGAPVVATVQKRFYLVALGTAD